MRAFAAIFTLAAAFVAQPALAGPVTAPVMDIHVDVPQDSGPQEVNVLTRVFPVGGSSGWHVHPGIEIGYVLSGETEMLTADAPPRRFKAGESFVIPRGVAHNGVNAGSVPVRLVITYAVDKGAPMRIPVPAPPAP